MIVAPDVVKGGFVLGARHGHGVLLVRQKGGWSDPVFVTLTGGSIGLQAGVSATDLFLVIRNARSLDRIFKGAGKLALGADATVAAGPVGREVAGATDAQLKAEILAYSRTRGLFGGVALDGDTILVDHAANERYLRQAEGDGRARSWPGRSAPRRRRPSCGPGWPSGRATYRPSRRPSSARPSGSSPPKKP